MKSSLLPAVVAIALAAGCSKRDTGASAPEPATAPAAVAQPAPGAGPALPGADGADAAPVAEVAAACDPEAAKQFIEQAYTPELGEQARIAAGARVVRALRPGQITTMEFLEDRLTLTLDESGRIDSVSCG